MSKYKIKEDIWYATNRLADTSTVMSRKYSKKDLLSNLF